MQLADIKKLATLARMDISDEELVTIAGSFDSILAYVGQVQEVSELSEEIEVPSPLENVTRDDVVTNTPNQWTEKILAEMPDTQDGYLKVKQIL
jgi:aspartyl-tRNA(Asn)/glutamyl-tRNA(Gln) amidotransferase subunit C